MLWNVLVSLQMTAINRVVVRNADQLALTVTESVSTGAALKTL